MNDSSLTQTLITDKSQLTEVFRSGIKSKLEFKIGIEHEKIGVKTDTFEYVPYSGKCGILEFLKEYKEINSSWTFWPDDKIILGLDSRTGRITLEPGSQLEFSSMPQDNIHELKKLLDSYTNISSILGKKMGIYWLGYGLQPLSTFSNINQIPKDRYKIMAEYLPQKAKAPFIMMRESAGMQIAIDYDSEEDCMRKLKLSLALSPIVTAMFANSPIRNKEDSGYKSYRALGWLNVDEDRCGLIHKKFFELSYKDLSFDDYAEVLLDLPMIFLEKDLKWFNMNGMSFKSYLKEGFNGYRATIDDWNLHLTSFFPDIRLKSYIEVRNCDSQRAELIYALPALWKGLMYTENALSASFDLVKDFSWEDVQVLRKDVPKLALNSEIKNKKVLDYTKELVRISENSLKEQAKQNNHESESIYLEPLKNLLNNSKSPADNILELWHGEWNKDLSKLIEYSILK